MFNVDLSSLVCLDSLRLGYFALNKEKDTPALNQLTARAIKVIKLNPCTTIM
jgi:hypothetical protein